MRIENGKGIDFENRIIYQEHLENLEITQKPKEESYQNLLCFVQEYQI